MRSSKQAGTGPANSKRAAASRANGARSFPQRRGDDPPSASSAGSDSGLAVLRASKKGPVTPQGKRNSSRNSFRHGPLASTVVLEEERADRFHELLNGYLDEHQPRTPTERDLVETMAVARWRQLRIWGMQKTAMDRDIALQDPGVGPAPVRAVLAFKNAPETSCSPELLLRYEIAFDRQFARAL